MNIHYTVILLKKQTVLRFHTSSSKILKIYMPILGHRCIDVACLVCRYLPIGNLELQQCVCNVSCLFNTNFRRSEHL